MTALFTYTFAATAPAQQTAHLDIEGVTPETAKDEAREEAADLLGVRAEHVVLRLVETKPNF